MDSKTKELVGIAAAIAGHCEKCFAYHYAEAKKLEVDKKDIEETVEFAKTIRAAGNKGIDEVVNRAIR